MKKSRFTEQQIAYALRQAESGIHVEEITRKMGVTQATFYRWKKKFAGMGIAELRRLKQLEDANNKLKRLVADLSLDRAMLQDVRSKKVGSLSASVLWLSTFRPPIRSVNARHVMHWVLPAPVIDTIARRTGRIFLGSDYETWQQ